MNPLTKLNPQTSLNYSFNIPTFDLNDNPSLADGVKRLKSRLCFEEGIVEIREILTSLAIVLACTKHKNKIIDIFNWKLNRGGVVNCILNHDGHTPLIKAIQNGLLDLSRCLLNEYGADVTISDHFGQTPLHHAVRNNTQSIGLVQLLLDHDGYNRHPCRVNLKDNFGNTPLHLAEDLQVVQLLLRNGAKVDMRNHLGQTPLYCQAESSSNEIVEELLYYPSRRRSSEDNARDPKSLQHHEYYDYDRIHCIKSNDGSTPYDVISHWCQVLESAGVMDSQKQVRTYNQYEQHQQQLKRSIIYSYLLSRHEIESKKEAVLPSNKEEVGGKGGEEGEEEAQEEELEEGVAFKKQKTTKE